MSDLIERQAAIDAVNNAFDKETLLTGFVRSIAVRAIRDMPSAQPEERTEEHTETHACDCISRKDAIRWIKTECNPYGKPTLDFESGKRVMKHLEQMPPAQPEPKWIPCSERLPETDEFVLVSLSGRYKNIRFEHACEIADYADNEWFINTYPGMTAEIANDLIEAWMPLPEPYKEGET